MFQNSRYYFLKRKYKKLTTMGILVIIFGFFAFLAEALKDGGKV